MMEKDMFAKHLALALLGTTLVAAPVLAQTNQPASSSAPASGQTSTSSWMTHEQPGQWRASKLEGLDVYNQNNEKIGDISELIVDQSGQIQAVVVGVGGFLGMDQHDVAISFNELKFVNEPRATASTAKSNGPAATGTVTTDRTANAASRQAPDHAVLTVNMTKEQLKAAPEFKYAR
jgi:sporulation protein YlmC with PRC-barrel domain